MSQVENLRTQVLRLDGEYDLTREDELIALFERLDGDRPITIDLTQVTYIDSTVFKELAKLRLRVPDCSITIAGANHQIERVLKLLGFDRVFRVSASA